jgi:LmbE family N-acetylglucosaminyl deacetylase
MRDQINFTSAFTAESRLMLIAPHPDDESVGCSVILQRAVRAGAAIQVIYATDGDDNPWPQRMLERKWRITALDRRRWGKLRRAEAFAALRVLGVDVGDAQFLGLPDQGLTELLRTDSRPPLARFSQIIRDWSPTDLLIPSMADTHPDHSALGVVLSLALGGIAESNIMVWSYAIHGRSPGFFSQAQQYCATDSERATKLAAILCHKSQIKLSRRRFLSYAARPERLLRVSSIQSVMPDGAIASVARNAGTLRVNVRLAPKLVQIGEAALYLFGRHAAGAWRCGKMTLPIRSSRIAMTDCASGQHHCTVNYRGNAFAGEFTIPMNDFSAAHSLFVKLERRSLFFDEAGWIQVHPNIRPQSTESLAAFEPSFATR